MPIFEYRCCECGSKFERIVASESTGVVCEKCSSPRVEKLLSVFAAIRESRQAAPAGPDPCPCGAPLRGMCGD